MHLELYKIVHKLGEKHSGNRLERPRGDYEKSAVNGSESFLLEHINTKKMRRYE